jgi:WD40 repeat protein
MESDEGSSSGESRKSLPSSKPELYAARREGGAWRLDRRGFIAGIASAGAGLAVGRGVEARPTEKADSVSPADGLEGECKGVLAHAGSAGAVIFSTDGERLFSGGQEKTVKTWSVAEGELEKVFEKHDDAITALAASPDGRWLISGDNNGLLCVWDLKKQKLRKAKELDPSVSTYLDEIDDLAVSPDGKYLFAQHYQKIFILAIPRLKPVEVIEPAATPETFALSADGKWLAVSNYRTIELWSIDEKKMKARLQKTIEGLDRTPYDLAFSPDGKYLASADSQALVKIWSVPSGSLYKSFSGQHSLVLAIAFSPDGKFLATAGKIDNIRLWAVPSFKYKRSIGTRGGEHWEWIKALAYSPDGKTIASVQLDGGIKLWDVMSGDLRRCLFDIDANDKKVEGRTYRYNAGGGKWVKVTYPACACAPQLPEKAKCICDTVPGTNPCSCVGYICSCQGHGGCSLVYYYPN